MDLTHLTAHEALTMRFALRTYIDHERKLQESFERLGMPLSLAGSKRDVKAAEDLLTRI
jgi:hypothetical protein